MANGRITEMCLYMVVVVTLNNCSLKIEQVGICIYAVCDYSILAVFGVFGLIVYSLQFFSLFPSFHFLICLISK